MVSHKHADRRTKIMLYVWSEACSRAYYRMLVNICGRTFWPRGSVAKKYTRFHYPFWPRRSVAKKSIPDFSILFGHGGLWLKSIADYFTILFSHGDLWLKSTADFTILFSHGGRGSVAKKYSRFLYTF